MKTRRLIVPATSLSILLAACDGQAPAPDKAASGESAPQAAAADLRAPQGSPQSLPQVSPQAMPSADMALSRKVKQALESGQGSNAIPSSGHVEVAAAAGVVTLYGTVDAASEKERAALLAMGVEGVRSVVNNLVVVRGS